jgi:general secretion pathway protein I
MIAPPPILSARRNARAMGGARRARGFTLIEMIAAFVVFAIAIGALMQILTMSMNNARRSIDETRAALWAQTLLDNVGIGERVEAGSTSGEFDKIYRWEMHVEQIDPELVAANVEGSMGAANVASQVGNGGSSPIIEVPQIELYHVELDVFWGDRMRERSAHFSTLRTATPDPTRGTSLGALGGGSSSVKQSSSNSGSRSNTGSRSSNSRGGTSRSGKG